ncbi:hypothetical protein FS749_000860 [Ceratobasidium sp. UAMH 11750]|nr:hypothetical protein FS749_000860 [Ceratobasidium sp. UAMH 11750]
MKMANFKPHDWEWFKETPADREVKAQLERNLSMTLPEWAMVVWGPRAMLYDPTPEMFEERGDELVESRQNGCVVLTGVRLISRIQSPRVYLTAFISYCV